MAPEETDPAQIKKRISPRLLAVPGVSGVGVPRGRLTVYLVEDSEAVRRSVSDALAELACEAPVDFVATGAFRKQ